MVSKGLIAIGGIQKWFLAESQREHQGVFHRRHLRRGKRRDLLDQIRLGHSEERIAIDDTNLRNAVRPVQMDFCLNIPDPRGERCDDDEFSDWEEVALGFDPFNPDEDGDGMLDGFEYHNGLDPTIDDAGGDLDDDMLTNFEEFLAGSFPYNPDSDNDELSDFLEVKILHSNPRSRDSDGDRLEDGLEVNELYSDPTSIDSDGDGMDDRYEYIWGLDVIREDSLFFEKSNTSA